MTKFWVLVAWDGEHMEAGAIAVVKVATLAEIPAAARAMLAKRPRATVTVLEAMKNATIPTATPITWEDLVTP